MFGGRRGHAGLRGNAEKKFKKRTRRLEGREKQGKIRVYMQGFFQTETNLPKGVSGMRNSREIPAKKRSRKQQNSINKKALCAQSTRSRKKPAQRAARGGVSGWA